MIRRMILPLLFGLVGTAILIGLGLWQLDRLDWKNAILSEIESRIALPPVALPDSPDPVRDRYLSVSVAGRFTGAHLDVLASRKDRGPGFRIVSGFETDEGRLILIDRGFLPQSDRRLPRQVVGAAITGTLHWPDEVDAFTPAPDPAQGIWFARDLPAMAAALGTEPVLVVAATPTGDGIDPWPVGTAGIPNGHAGYAATWFSLAVLWLGMTVLLLWRIRRKAQ